jgi:hypothetical protein
MHGHPVATSLVAEVSKPASPLRASLSGDMVETLLGFLNRAATDGTIYAALYELGDDELIPKLQGLGRRLRLAVQRNQKRRTHRHDHRLQPACARTPGDQRRRAAQPVSMEATSDY